MPQTFDDLDNLVSWPGMLGYLNFSAGKPDARFQKQLSDAYGYLAERGVAEPWTALHELLRGKLDALKAAGSGAFRDTRQAEAMLDLVFFLRRCEEFERTGTVAPQPQSARLRPGAGAQRRAGSWPSRRG